MTRTLSTLLALGLLLGLGAPAYAGAIKAGSFAKSTSTGTQVITHGLGTTPRAVILWTNGKTNETVSASHLFAFGMSDGTTSYAIAAASENDAAGSRSNASRRIANKALTIVQWGEQLLAEADLQSWTATTLTLNWTTNNGSAYVVHYLVVGGNGVSAKVVGWQLNATSGTQSITSVGFQPDVVIHAHAGDDFTAAPPATRTSSAFGLGVMDVNGAQWANTQYTLDNSGRSDTQRYQRTDRTLVTINTTPGVSREATFLTMLSNGFIVQLPGAGAVTRMGSLALRGVRVKAGSLNKSVASAPVDQAVSGLTFRPHAILLSSVQDVTEAAPAVHSRFGLGVADQTSEGSIAWQDTDGLNWSSVDGVDKTSKAFVKINNNSSVIDAEADLKSLDTSGFTLRWTTNDAVATELLYLALAPRQRVWLVE